MEFTWSWVEAFIFAIVAALLLTGLSWLIQRYARREWVGTFVENGNRYSEEISIFEFMGHVFGRSKLSFEQDGKHLFARYKIRGINKHAIITAYFEGTDNSERGAFLIKYHVKKNEYNGSYLLIDHEDGISKVDYHWAKRP